MKIGIIVINPYIPDIRVEKEAQTLVGKGYDVTIVAREANDSLKTEMKDGIKIIRIGPAKNSAKGSRINNIRYLLNTVREVRKQDCQILHAHDLDAFIVAAVSRVSGGGRKYIIYDAHEVPSAAYCQEGTFLSKLVSIFEILMIKVFAHKVIVVVDENKVRLSAYNIPNDDIIVCSNTAQIEKLRNLANSTVRQQKEKMLISYVGGFSYHRGLDVLIRSFSEVLKVVENVELMLVGDGDEKERLIELSKAAPDGSVTFTGWLTFSQAMDHIKKSDICVLPYRSTIETNHTIPHKLFQYMYYKKPVVASDVKPLKRIVEEADCGIVYANREPNDLSRVLITLLKDAQLREICGENGYNAVIEKYNWAVDGKKLITMYEEFNEKENE